MCYFYLFGHKRFGMPRAKKFDEKEVLQKAMLLFWRKGYHDTSIADLIAFLGSSNASIYHTFGGKRQLYLRAFQWYREINYEGLKVFLSTQEDTITGLRGVFQKIISDDCQDPDGKGCFIVNTTIELVPMDAELERIIAGHQRKTEALFRGFIERGQNRGQISADKNSQTLASLLYTLMTGLRVMAKTKPKLQESFATVETVLASIAN